jgi:hypothetical protein
MDKVRIVSMQSVSIERLFCDGPPSSLELVAKFCAQVTTEPLIFFADPAMRSSLSVTAFSRHGCYPRVFGCGDPTVWKIPECEPRRQVRNVLTQRALYRQGCARLADPESAVAPIAAAPWISLPRRRPCCRQMISSAAWKTAIAALGATPHATTKPSEFLSAQLLSTATAAAPCQQIPDPHMLVAGLLFAVTGLVERGDSSFNRPSCPFARPTVQTLDRRPNLHGITTWNRRRALAAM